MYCNVDEVEKRSMCCAAIYVLDLLLRLLLLLLMMLLLLLLLLLLCMFSLLRDAVFIYAMIGVVFVVAGVVDVHAAHIKKNRLRVHHSFSEC